MTHQVLVDGRRYRLGHVLGSGGQATVRYLDAMQGGNEPLAQKCFNQLSSFRTEVRTLQRISEGGGHNNVMNMIDSDEPTLRIVMPWLAGGTLRQLIERVRLAENQIAFVLQGILNGLEALHDWRIIHGDLKPDNILLRPDGVPVITDYGLALDLGEAMDGHGTRGFKSPETVEADKQRALGVRGKPVTHKTDTFAIPLIAIQCVLDGESLCTKEPTAGEIGLEKAPPAERAHYIFNRLRSMFVSLEKAPPRLATFAGDTLTLLGQRALTAANMKKHTFIHNLAKHGRIGFVEAVQLTTKLNEKKALMAKLADAEEDINEIKERLRQAGTLRNDQRPTKNRLRASSNGRVASDVQLKHDAFNKALDARKTNLHVTNSLKSKKYASNSSFEERGRLPCTSTIIPPTSVKQQTNKVQKGSRRALNVTSRHSSGSDVSRSRSKKIIGKPLVASYPSSSSNQGQIKKGGVFRKTTKGKKAASYKCPHTDCPKKANVFTRKFEYDDHLKAHNGDYDCKPCAQRLWSRRAWNNHVALPKHAENVATSNAKNN